jgi:hypothetical protein
MADAEQEQDDDQAQRKTEQPEKYEHHRRLSFR